MSWIHKKAFKSIETGDNNFAADSPWQVQAVAQSTALKLIFEENRCAIIHQKIGHRINQKPRVQGSSLTLTETEGGRLRVF